ncbi:TPA: DUF3265 domain-containing protein [Vibrio vulnificus]|nr:DUF3265 domain-containing protein [Vibrio vulnificus]
MTKRLRGIWHAWHFRFALGSVIKSLCGSFCSACLHPLTRRYELVIQLMPFRVRRVECEGVREQKHKKCNCSTAPKKLKIVIL